MDIADRQLRLVFIKKSMNSMNGLAMLCREGYIPSIRQPQQPFLLTPEIIRQTNAILLLDSNTQKNELV